MTKIRQEALDNATDRPNFKNPSSTYDNRDSYSPSNDIKFASRENGGEGNERGRSSTDDKFPVTGTEGTNNGDCGNLFIYEFPEEDCPSDYIYESFVEADRGMRSSEDIAELGTKRKRKFSTPSKLTLSKELPPFTDQCPVPGRSPPESSKIKTDVSNGSSIVFETTADVSDDLNLKDRGSSEYNASQCTITDDTFYTNESVDKKKQEKSWNGSGKKSVDENFTQSFQLQKSMEFTDEYDNVIERATRPKYGQRYRDDEEICADYFGDHSQTNGNNLDFSLEFEKEAVIAIIDDNEIPGMFPTEQHKTVGEISIEQSCSEPFRPTSLKKRHRDESNKKDSWHDKEDNAMSSIESIDVSKEILASEDLSEIPSLTIRSIADQVEVTARRDVRGTSDAYMAVHEGGDIHDDVKTLSSHASPTYSGLVLHSIEDKSYTSVVKNFFEADLNQNAVEALGVDGPSRIIGGCTPHGAYMADLPAADIGDDVPTPAVDGSYDISDNVMMGEEEVSVTCSARGTSDVGMTVPSEANMRDDAKTSAVNDFSDGCLVGELEVSAMGCEMEVSAKNASDASMTVPPKADTCDAVETLTVDGTSCISDHIAGEVAASATSGARYASDAGMIITPAAVILIHVDVQTIAVDGSSSISSNHIGGNEGFSAIGCVRDTSDAEVNVPTKADIGDDVQTPYAEELSESSGYYSTERVDVLATSIARDATDAQMADPRAADIGDDVPTPAVDGSYDISDNVMMDEVEVSVTCSARGTSDVGMTVPSEANMRDDVKTIEVNQSSDISESHPASEAAVFAVSSCARYTSDVGMTVPSEANMRDNVKTKTVDGSSSLSRGGTAGETKILAVSISLHASVRDDVESQAFDRSSGTAVFVHDSAASITGATETSNFYLE
jgi:hypothetical protein